MARNQDFVPVAVSKLKERAREFAFELAQANPGTESNRLITEEIGWDGFIDEYKFPKVYRWDDDAPEEVLSQLVGQTVGFGMMVEYRKRACLVVYLEIRSKEFHWPFTDKSLEKEDRSMTIVPLEYIDLNA